ncbi:MAG TPA: GntR family transcriptional regulator [Cyclobacteriaceae bacterium]|jgi:DNA-binding transcriptional regulator YhcF (GntR family)|nr:GntR family transcriptional regulator [Cyclobacteriaceae bacterium]
MPIPNLNDWLTLDDHSATPKYLQLANGILRATKEKKIKAEEILPSINELSFQLDISRDTVEKGYKYLKEKGILGSVPGKGYFIKNTRVDEPLKLFLLFNKLSAHKKIIYDAIFNQLQDQAILDLYIYNNDFALFKKLLNQKIGDYSHYIIIPHFIDGGENAPEIINQIDKQKLILLDKMIGGVSGDFGAVYENFEKDIYVALEQALPRLSNYNSIKIIFPDQTYFPTEIIRGFRKFCDEYAFSQKVVNSVDTETLAKGEVFICLMESDLVALVEKAIASDLKVGSDIGVISYNETPLKKIILNGITTISTDFQRMGERVASMILQNQLVKEEVPFYLTLRPSL